MNRHPHLFKLLSMLPASLVLCAALYLSAQSDLTETQPDWSGGQTNTNDIQPGPTEAVTDNLEMPADSVEVSEVTNSAEVNQAEVLTNNPVEPESALTGQQTNLVEALRGLLNAETTVNQEPPVTAEVNPAASELPASPAEEQAMVEEAPVEEVATPAPVSDEPANDIGGQGSPVEVQEVPTVEQAQPIELPEGSTDVRTNTGEELNVTTEIPAATNEEAPAQPDEPEKQDETTTAAPEALTEPAGGQVHLNEVPPQADKPTNAIATLTKPAEVPAKPVEVPSTLTQVKAEPPQPAAKTVEVAKQESNLLSPATNQPPAPVQIPQSIFAVPKTLKEGRDPFFPDSLPTTVAASTNAAPPEVSETVELTLQGISGTADRPLAIINNVVFGQGEQGFIQTGTGRFRIRCIEIRTDSVVIEVGSSRQELRLRRRRS